MGDTIYSQSDRFLQVKSTLGPDDIILVEVEGTDTISAPFVYNIHFYTTQTDDKILALLGQPITLLLNFDQTTGAPARPINGLFRKVTGPSYDLKGYRGWRAEIVPQLAFLTYTSDCRIFQDKSVKDIVTQVLQLHQITKFQFRNLMGTYPKLDYCVQYRESALNFISRLLEHVGLYYWFEHDESSHTLIIADSVQAAKPISPEALLMTDQGRDQPILSLQADYTFRPGKWTLKDYDFVNPDSPLKSTTPTVVTEVPLATYEIFDYPGSHGDAATGDALSKVRIEQEESQWHRMRGASKEDLFNPGYQVTIAVPDANGNHVDTKLLLTEVYHHAVDFTTLSIDGSPPSYSNDFGSVPTKYNFRPPLLATKPFVQGVQTARVTGPAGKTIYTDKYGRVKVRFHWDRNPESNQDENSSCWLRVSQIWSSGTGGGVQVPRIGEEVIVDFIEGDPDRPIITGRVYNGNNATPYGFPGNSTQFGFKTQSVAAGGGAAASGFNELRFEDAAGSEHVFVQAQKDYIRNVINDENDTIGANVTRKVVGNVDHTTQGNETKTVNGTLTHTNVQDFTHNLNANSAITVGASATYNVAVAHTEKGPAKTSTWDNVMNFFKSHTTSTDFSITTTSQSAVAISTSTVTMTGVAFSMLGDNTQVIPLGQTVGVHNLQVFAINQQICGINQNLNLLDVSANVFKSDSAATALHAWGNKIMGTGANLTNAGVWLSNQGIKVDT